jgi:hypothetical protein
MIDFSLGDLVMWDAPSQDPGDYAVVGIVLEVRGMIVQVRWSDGVIGAVPMRTLAHLVPCDGERKW